jgi:hypothetical protein
MILNAKCILWWLEFSFLIKDILISEMQWLGNNSCKLVSLLCGPNKTDFWKNKYVYTYHTAAIIQSVLVFFRLDFLTFSFIIFFLLFTLYKKLFLFHFETCQIIWTGSVHSFLETLVLCIRLYNLIWDVLWFKKKDSLLTEGEKHISLCWWFSKCILVLLVWQVFTHASDDAASNWKWKWD